VPDQVSRPFFRSPWFQASLAALIVGAYLVWFLALQDQGGGNHGIFVYFTRLATIAAVPGLALGRLLLIGDHRVDPKDIPAFYAVVVGISMAWIWLVFWLIFRWQARQRRKTDRSRRAFLRRAASVGVMAGGGLLAGYSIIVEPSWLRVVRVRLPLAGLPASLSGLKVAHLTDLHLGRYISALYLNRVVQKTNEQKPDLVLLTGDYVHGSLRFIRPVFEILSGLESRLGTAGVLGNHDHWEDAAESFRQMRAAGIHVLDNKRLFVSDAGLSTSAAPATGLCVAGVGDLWEDRQDLDALADAPADMPRLLLSHNPDFAEGHKARESKHRIDLMLAGHTHGGQVRLPGTRSIITPSRYGSKYAKGMVQGPAFPVFVSTGIGMTILPVRMLVRPEIVLFTLVPKSV